MEQNLNFLFRFLDLIIYSVNYKYRQVQESKYLGSKTAGDWWCRVEIKNMARIDKTKGLLIGRIYWKRNCFLAVAWVNEAVCGWCGRAGEVLPVTLVGYVYGSMIMGGCDGFPPPGQTCARKSPKVKPGVGAVQGWQSGRGTSTGGSAPQTLL